MSSCRSLKPGAHVGLSQPKMLPTSPTCFLVFTSFCLNVSDWLFFFFLSKWSSNFLKWEILSEYGICFEYYSKCEIVIKLFRQTKEPAHIYLTCILYILCVCRGCCGVHGKSEDDWWELVPPLYCVDPGRLDSGWQACRACVCRLYLAGPFWFLVVIISILFSQANLAIMCFEVCYCLSPLQTN